MHKSDTNGLLDEIMQYAMSIEDVGVAGFMKLPYKNTRDFALCPVQPDDFMSKNPKKHI